MRNHVFSKDKLRYLIPPAITLVIYSVILAVKGIYPFGSNTIDYYDMAQQIAAFYYHVYDALHGTKGFFYDWYTALGVNMAMSTSGCSNISPFNLFFLFIRRGSLLKSLSVFNGIKLMCMSASMYFYLHKTHAKSPEFFKLAASVGYSFCGFVLVLYITNQWIDIAVMFPLIMYFYDKLLKTGRMTGYVITLTITLIASYYLGFMILIFIFLYTGVILVGEKMFLARKPLVEKKERTIPLFQLGIGTVLSLALSAFIIVPQLTQMLSSARFKNGNGSESSGLIGKYLEILSHVQGDYTTRWWSLLGISFMAAVILTGLLGCIRKHIMSRGAEGSASVPEDHTAGITMTDILSRKPILMTVVLILIMVLELFIESINLIWHFGSYVQYPIRNGFIIYFVFAYLSCFFAQERYAEEPEHVSCDDEKSESQGKQGASDRSYFGCIITVVGFLIFIAVYRNHTGMQLRTVFHMTSVMMTVTFLFYMILLNYEGLKRNLHFKKAEIIEEDIKVSRDRRLGMRYRWAAGVIAFEILCYGFLLFGRPDFITGYAEEPEQNGEYINICEQLRDKLDLDSEFLYRIKNPDTSLNANYGLVLMQPALSNWTHMIAPGEQSGAARWGYSIQFTRILDSGGTVFSDALLGIRKIISCVPMDERLYEPVSSCTVTTLSGEPVVYTLYEAKYSLPFGVVIKDDEEADKELETAMENKDIVGLHNTMFECIKRSSGPEDAGDMARWIIRNGSVKDEEASVDDLRTGTDREIMITTRIGEETALYFMGNRFDGESGGCTVEVNESGTIIRVPTIGDMDNTRYPIHFNNNALYLGCYKDETVTLKVVVDTAKLDDLEVNLMGISMDAMEKLCSSYGPEYDDMITAGGNTLSFTAEASGTDNRMLLPLTYDKGWKVISSGKHIKAAPIAGLFTVIPLNDGENTVSMKFTPPGMIAGCILSLIALAGYAACGIVMKIMKETAVRVNEGIARISGMLAPVYIIVFAIAMLFMYVIPMVYGAFAVVAK